MSSRAQGTGAQLPSGTVTFLFTDIERSTEHLAALGNDAYADALDLHRRLLRDAFGAHGGHEIGTEGDSFFVAFARAHDAVDAASSGQRSLDDHPLRVRIGIHTGEAIVRHGGYVGHDVHKAKRISDAGHGGQVLVSQTTADLVRDRVRLVDLGPHRLKDLGEPERIFQVGEGDFPPLRSLESFRHTLPSQRSSFIGREREIATVTELLQENRLVTIHGVGGCGKTRLAVQVGAEMLDAFPDGVFFADLAPVPDGDGIAHAVALAVHYPVRGMPGAPGGSAASDADVLRFLAERRCLLILDNCEHLLDACAALTDRLLATCPQVRVLATSREAFQIEGEQAWRLPSLSLPSDDGHISESEAVSLFAARARAADGSFAMTADDAPAIAEICRRLDGIPLAIEFAAGRVTHLSVRQIAQKLDDRFRLLTGGRRQVQRQQTLQAALDWSYDLLEEPERILLRRLAVFPADFSLEAAEGICSGDDLDTSMVFDLLGSLVAKSLVDARPRGHVVRYRLLETVRAYAADRLSLAGETQEQRDRHAAYYVAQFERLGWDEALGYAIVGHLAREIVNLKSAIDWSEAAGHIEHVAALVSRMNFAGPIVGLADERVAWARQVLGSGVELAPTVLAACRLTAGRFGERWTPDRRHLLSEILAEDDRIDPAMRAVVLSQRGIVDGIVASFTSDAALMESSRQDHEEARALAAGLHPSFRLLIEVSNGMNELDLSNPYGAVEAFEQAQRTLALLTDETGWWAGELATCYYLGAALYAIGETERAAEMVLRSSRAAEALELDLVNLRIFFGGGAPTLAVADRRAALHLLLDNLDEVRRTPLEGLIEDWVNGAAGVLAVAGDHVRAAKLLSWARTRTIDRGIPPASPAVYAINQRNVKIVREALGAEEAHRCRDEGRALTEDEAVELAIDGLKALDD